MIYALGHVSGAHFNPAVTFAFALGAALPWPRVGAYWAAQLAGASRPRCVLRARWEHRPRRCDPAVRPQGSGVPVGAVMSVFLMLVIMAVATDTRAVGEAAAIAIGGTVGLDAMFGGPISGASMNPTRSLGPASSPATWHAIWVYLLAPLIGAAIAGVVYQLLRTEPHEAVAPEGH